MATTEKVVSPVGVLEWVTITGEGKENLSGKMQYVANLVLEDEEANALKAKIDKFWEENKPNGFKKAPKSLGHYPHKKPTGEKDPETGKNVYEETGKTMFAFKTGTEYADGKPKVINTYNAKGNKVDLGEQTIGNGSVGAISGAMGVYVNKTKTGTIVDAGVTLYLNAIQLAKFVPFTQDEGFGEIDGDFTGANEDGFEPQETPEQPRL